MKLLDRIIKVSSNERDVVFDPFCGCGTTIEAAHNLNRNWIGCDIAYHAINRVSKVRLRDRCHLEAGTDYEITGLPFDEATAYELWKRDPHHFQKWVVEYVDGFAPARRSGDGGIDGRIYFEIEGSNFKAEPKSMALQVKGGEKVKPDDLRAFYGAMVNDKDALLGGFIVRKHVTGMQRANFEKFMADSGVVEINSKVYPRLQMLSVPEILEGQRFHMPYSMGHRSSAQLKLSENL